MNNKEQLIKEARVIEAMKNGYMGLEGKFAIIARNLGSPIIQQGDFFESHYENDPFYEFDQEEIQTLDENDNSRQVGVFFDGLKYGINMSITLSEYLREIKCVWEGKTVYLEVAGELEGYVPNSDWEAKIEHLNLIAKKAEIKNKINEKQKTLEEVDKKKNQIINYLRDKWGI